MSTRIVSQPVPGHGRFPATSPERVSQWPTVTVWQHCGSGRCVAVDHSTLDRPESPGRATEEPPARYVVGDGSAIARQHGS